MSRLTSLYADLLFVHGHIADPQLAISLSGVKRSDATPRIRSNPMNFFKSLMYLGGLESVDLRINEDGSPYGPTYGNRIASEQAFGKSTSASAPAQATRTQRPASREALPAGCH